MWNGKALERSISNYICYLKGLQTLSIFSTAVHKLNCCTFPSLSLQDLHREIPADKQELSNLQHHSAWHSAHAQPQVCVIPHPSPFFFYPFLPFLPLLPSFSFLHSLPSFSSLPSLSSISLPSPLPPPHPSFLPLLPSSPSHLFLSSLPPSLWPPLRHILRKQY